MKIVEEYIKKRKQESDSNNEQEHTEILDLITTGKVELEKYTRFIEKKLLEIIKG